MPDYKYGWDDASDRRLQQKFKAARLCQKMQKEEQANRHVDLVVEQTNKIDVALTVEEHARRIIGMRDRL